MSARAKRSLAACWLALWLLLSPPSALAAGYSPRIVALTINGTPRGDLIIQQADDGRYFLPRAEFAEFVQLPADLEGVSIDGEPHVAADAIRGTTVDFDPATLTLSLDLPAVAFAPQRFNLSSRARQSTPRGDDASLIVNYRLQRSAGDLAASTSLLSDQALRWQGWLLENGALHRRGEAGDASLRLQTRLRRDDTTGLRRLVLGDQRGRAGDALGASSLIGGITFGRAFELAPHLVRFPTASLAGSVTAPAEVEFFVGEDRVFRGQVAPGPFEVSDFNYYGGLQDLRLVVRDVTGGVQVLEQSFYFANEGLGAGLSDYEWRAGLQRENLGSRSGDYGDFAFGGFYRRGISDALTAGIRLDGSEDAVNGGPSLVVTLPRYGIFGLTAAVNTASGQAPGTALALEYGFQAGRFSAQLFGRLASASYRPPGSAVDREPAREQYGGTLSFGSGRLGSFSLSLSRRVGGELPRSDLRLNYSRNLAGRLALQLGAQRRSGENADEELQLALRYRFGGGMSASSSLALEPGAPYRVQADAASDTPQGPGYVWRVGSEQRQGEEQLTRSRAVAVKRQSRYIDLGVDVQQQDSNADPFTALQLTAAGSLILVDGKTALSRPVEDAFALVEVHPGLDGVRVYHNNQPVGRTNARGRLLVPGLIALTDNAVRIDPDDIPFDYRIDTDVAALNPAPGSGTLLRFPVQPVRAVTGRLLRPVDGREEALEYHTVTLERAGEPLKFTTGHDGAFYFEDLAPGRYAATLRVDGRPCRFTLERPDEEAPIVDLGALTVCRTQENSDGN